MVETYDIVVAGGGHNGLVAASYLAKAGLTVCVVEKNDKVGGGVMTRELTIPGFKHDVCSVAHTLLQANPLLRNDELKLLSTFGLNYLNPDKMTSIFYDDGSTLEFYTDLEKTAQSIAKFSAKDADAYRRFNEHVFGTLDLMVTGMFNTPPSYGHQTMLMDSSPEGRELLRTMSISSWDLIGEWFENDKVKIALARYASEAMINPFDNGTGFGFYIILPFMHRYGVGVPAGGSGAFADALRACLESHGGVVRTSCPIKQIKLDGRKATGVILESGEEILATRAVVTNLHAKQIFPHMVPGVALPDGFEARIRGLKPSSFQPFNMHVALKEPPKYKVGPAVDDFFWVERSHSNAEEFEKAFRDLERGYPRRDFVAYVTQDSVDKGGRAPEGKRVLNMYAFCPYDLKDGGPQRWDEIGNEVAQGFLNDLKALTTNMDEDNILGFSFMTPLDIERHNNAMIGADILHFGSYSWQIGGNRPVAGWGQYRSPVDQLFLCGASTHPGGGVTAASGRNVARLLMEEFGIDFDKVVAA
ncbi:NAD(P)/FAD-dependent oxidoreductase [Azospirillum sp. INR13]|uniref:phytoene desaturase family protein n=1 Tax=Azospirillum sp. INR13 TaxID=2596919 RepID=UPI001891F96E|nr:NAD(P)/FAD-dependent oxidoreductase [Azospirillum sp. INR13]MBF5094192.1 NAD(P)/FAD-dependent oxidoreductase [Azospirillum sp. INR13]